MKLTNKHNLPHPMLMALAQDSHPPIPGRFGVTSLIDAPLRRLLVLRHWEEIEEDASDHLWVLLGKAAHTVLERHTSIGLAEQKTEWTHSSGATIVWVTDHYHEREILDWKVTSVWSFLLGEKLEWERQLNLYGLLHKLVLKQPVNSITIYAILRDWQKAKTMEKDYPPIPFIRKDIPLWDIVDAELYLDSRIALHRSAEEAFLMGKAIEICSPEERWKRPPTFALVRKIGERAYRVKESRAEAEELLPTCPGYIIEERPGKDVRCIDYCNVRQFCSYGRTLKD